MRETLDCGVLMVPAHAGWISGWIDRHAANMARLRLHPVDLDNGALLVASNGLAQAYAGAQAATHALARMAMSLRRFDACLLPVAPDTLGWTRTALSCAREALRTPLIGLARGLKAAAVEDLLALGMCDFVRDPLCPEELRVRVDRVAGGRRAALGDVAACRGSDVAAGRGSDVASGQGCDVASGRGGDAAVGRGGDAWAGGSGDAHSAVPEGWGVLARDGHVRGRDRAGVDDAAASGFAALPGYAAYRPVQEPAVAYAAVQARGESRPRVPREAIDSGLLAIQAAPRVHPDEPFRIAKSRVVDSFERDYVRTALSRHAGNVARAARASAKHRRAFWALMRKHHIDAAPYRPRQDLKDRGG